MPETRVDQTFLSFQEALAGRYSLEHELGRGGMGIVYLAREVRLDRPVAIKLLPPEYAANQSLRDRFLREARTAARLSHPYIVPIHAVDEVGPFVFYVMSYVHGETLADRVRREGPLRPADASRIMREVAWALAYAHAQGVVHRDIKPANIMLERGSDRSLVLDFGIARLATASGETGVGEVMGTPEYMSPEQACGEPVDGRSDLYSLGIVGYFMMTGTLPFSGGAREVLAKHVTQPAAPVASLARAVPKALASAIDRCLAKEPAARFPTGEALAESLAASLERRTDIPVPLRVFLDRRRNMVMVTPIAIGFPVIMSLLTRLTAGSATPDKAVFLTAVGAAMLLGPVAIVTTRLRHLMRQGYGPDDAAVALRTLFERKREEFLYEFGPEPGRREKLMRLAGITGFTVGGLAVLGLLARPLGLVEIGSGPLGAFSVLGTYIGIVTAIVASRWRALRDGTGPLLAKFWQGPAGRLLGRIAGHRLPRPTNVSDRPTELGIAMSAEALYAGFPKEQRRALGDVPAVLRALESQARAMRTRIAQLDESLGSAQQPPARAGVAERQEQLVADLRGARTAAERRLSDVVTALETLRLDLLRLQAGAGSTDSITQDLMSARSLGEDVDRLLEGQREVDEVVKLRG